MSVFASRPTLRWVLPAAALAGVIVAGSAGRMLVQDTSSALPERSPQQLLMDVAQAKVSALSGTIVQKSDLGLPSLPQLSGTDLNALVNGNHTVRVWYDGDQRVRVSAQNPDSSESDLIRNGTNLWTYSSASKTATHTALPHSTGATPGGTPSIMPSAGASELSGGIDQFLTTLAPTTKISTDGTAKVAGRQAYELVIQPKDSGTRIAQIRIAIDGTKHIPLQFQVYARGSNDPAFSAGFTSISFSKPDAAEFTFNPPAGTKVTQVKPHQNKADQNKADRNGPSQGKSGDTQVVGKGWTSVLVAKNVPTSAPAGKTADQKQAAAAADKFLKSLPKVHGAWGSGRLLQTKLFSALLTDDGRLIAGAVNPSQLYQAAEQTK